MSVTEMSAAQARALVLSAQGLAQPRPATVDKRALRAMTERLGVVQIDSVNVLVRSHYMPAFSRLGAYDRTQLDALAHRAPRALFEYWGHEASLLPVALQPLFRWRMARAKDHAWGQMRRIASKHPGFVGEVLAMVRDRGPVSASDLEHRPPGPARRKKAGWWEWSEAKSAIEWLFWSGQVTSAGRRGFERLYDLPERVLPAPIARAPTPSDRDAHRALIEIAARALGVATEADLRDYYRLSLADARAAIAELVEDGALGRAAVEGWTKPAYLPRRVVQPAAIDPERAALLSPFDSLVWFRDRTQRLFGMRYRIEIYVPQHKRVHGYYVLPFLLGGALVARVDLKADRATGTLRVQAAHAEPRSAKQRVARALAGELARMASWLDLARVEVVGPGDLATILEKAVTSATRGARSRPRRS